MTDKFKISHERLYRTHSSASLPWLDNLANHRFMVQKYPMWNHSERSKFIDASLLSNPLSKRSPKKWGEIYARTLAHFREVCRARLQGTPGKVSSAISELVENVRSNLDSVTVTDTRVLLPSCAPSTPSMAFEKVVGSNEINRTDSEGDRDPIEIPVCRKPSCTLI